jgi:hypothetical protein
VLLLLALGPAAVTWASPASDQALANAEAAYLKVLAAERAGGNVTSLVEMMNQALSLISQAQGIEASNPSEAASLYSQANSLIQEVQQQAPQVESAGAAAQQSQLLWLSAFLIALAVAGAAVFFFGSRVFWRAWIRLHRDWVVKKA